MRGSAWCDSGIRWMNFAAESALANTVDLRPYELRLAPGDTLTVVGLAVTGTPDLKVSLSWEEDF